MPISDKEKTIELVLKPDPILQHPVVMGDM